MNSLKTLFVVAVLGAVAYGVYVSINRNPETSEEMDTAPVWPEAPQVQLPGSGGAMPQYPPVGGTADTVPPFSSPPTGFTPGSPPTGGTPPTNTGSAAAPPYAPLVNPAPPTNGGMPPYPSPGDVAVSGSNSLRAPEGAPTDPLPGRPGQNAADEKYMALIQTVQTKLDEGRLAEALLALSSLYDNPDVPPEHGREIANLLDQLAGTVIYSRQHLLEPPYKVRPGETLEEIAEKYQVPPQVLAKINGIRDRQPLELGRELKVLRGPFNALVDLDKYELTLMVGGRYAGRFPIGVGRDHPNLEGSYLVRNKAVNSGGFDRDTPPAAAEADGVRPAGYWIDLGNQIGIHGTDDPQNLHRTGGRGSVCLGQRDIEDVFSILSVGSRVIIQR